MLALAALLGVSTATTPGNAQEFAGIGLAPKDATLVFRIDRRADTGRWVGLALDAIQTWRAPIQAAWESTDLVVSRLAPDASESIHAIGPGGRRWFHAARWHDPLQLEHGLQRLGSRPMGGGRFGLPAHGLAVIVLDRWLILGPRDSPWLDEVADRAGLELHEAGDVVMHGLVQDLEAAPIELLIRHPEPIAGITAIGVHPRAAGTARLEITGRYEASPLPIRPSGMLEADVVARFDGRVACAVVESGVGLLDPLMVRLSSRHPEIVPTVDVRRRFASRRLFVLDGEAVTVPRLGIIEVPAACVAVPFADHAADVPTTLGASIDGWLAAAGHSFRRTWTNTDAPVTRTRGDEIRHLSLDPGLLQATGGHPMAMAASLNWTLHENPTCGTWLVAGTSPGIVRRVVATLDETTTTTRHEPCAMAGVASPARIAMQLAELASLRRLARDESAIPDAESLAAAATVLDRIERISWHSSRQDERELRITAEVRLVPGPTPR